MCSNFLIALAVVLAFLWAQSKIRGYAANVYTEVIVPSTGNYTSHQRAWASSDGRMWFAYIRSETVEESARHEKRLRVYHSPIPLDEVERYDAPSWVAWLGFDWKASDRSSTDARGYYVYRDLSLVVPYWLLITISGGAGWGIGRRPRLVRRRIKRGLCTACGYDVRATPERCPECGYGANEGYCPVPASASA